jgi:hypothetical protein
MDPFDLNGVEKRFHQDLFDARIISDFLGSATVPVASVGVPPTERCVAGSFTLPVAIRAGRE